MKLEKSNREKLNCYLFSIVCMSLLARWGNDVDFLIKMMYLTNFNKFLLKLLLFGLTMSLGKSSSQIQVIGRKTLHFSHTEIVWKKDDAAPSRIPLNQKRITRGACILMRLHIFLFLIEI